MGKLSGKTRTHVATNLGQFTTAEFFGVADADGDGIFEIADLSDLKGKTAYEVLSDSGMLWEVKQSPVKYEVGGILHEAPGQFVNYRSDTGAWVGTVGAYYVPESPKPWLQFAEDAVHMTGGQWLGAGSLQNGRTIVAAARLLEPVFIGGDPDEGVVPMLIAKTGNGGNYQRELFVLLVRAVCCNCNVWVVPGVEMRWAGRHTARMLTGSQLQDAREVVGDAQATVAAFKQQTEGMLSTKVDEKTLDRLLAKVLPYGEDGKKAGKSKALITSVDNRRDAVKATFKNHADLQNITGTGYGFVQAVCQWQDWEARTKVHGERSRAEVLFERRLATNEYKDRAVAAVAALSKRQAA